MSTSAVTLQLAPVSGGKARHIHSLDRYRITGRLDAGGMAETLLAVHTQGHMAGKPVVIKRLLRDLVMRSEFVGMFLDEAYIASLMHHPNVVRVHEVIEEPEECLIVMDFIAGRSLSALLAKLGRSGQPFDPTLAAYVIAQAAAGLHYAHELEDHTGARLDIVHRDVSPQNILLSHAGEVKVIDFGIARAAGRITETDPGTRKGKPAYMAPEQVRGTAVDCRADIFALGVLLWEALAKRRLFAGANEAATMKALLMDPIPLPSAFAPAPAELEAIAMRALERDPQLRFASAEEMRLALEAYVAASGGATGEALAQLLERAFADEAADRKPPASDSDIGPRVLTSLAPVTPPRIEARRRGALFVAGGLGMIVLGATLGLALRRDRDLPVASTTIAPRFPLATRIEPLPPLEASEAPVLAPPASFQRGDAREAAKHRGKVRVRKDRARSVVAKATAKRHRSGRARSRTSARDAGKPLELLPGDLDRKQNPF
jgi:hypothetical protein